MRIQLDRGSILASALLAIAVGCGDSDVRADGPAAPAAAKAEANVISGRVTTADGKPITTPGVKLRVTTNGVATKSAERVQFSPAVKPDGTYRQKVPEGSYRVQYGKATVKHGEHEFTFDLEPQGDQYAEDRDSAEGIVQDFVWRVTGPTLMYKNGKLDPNNATHWNGLCLGVQWASYRDDLKSAPPVVPPEGSVMTFTLTPQPGKKGIDGSEIKPVTFERPWLKTAMTTYKNDDLNDFLPGDYTITGTVKFPDGTTKPLVFQEGGGGPWKSPANVPLSKDNLIGGMWKQGMGWGINP